jgi:hypothetical protein
VPLSPGLTRKGNPSRGKPEANEKRRLCGVFRVFRFS